MTSPVPNTKALDDKYLDEVFGARGFLSQKFPGYTPRQGQIELARAIHEVVSTGSHLIAEGPTGTGKSLAYLVPAIYIATRSARKCLVVTANIALQEQLISKDLPLLKSVLPWPFTFSLLKGRSNYLCKKNLDKLYQLKHPNVYHGTPDEKDFDTILQWSKNTIEGDRSELPFEPDSSMWSRVSVGVDECTGAECPRAQDCFSNKAKMKAQMVDVVVTNYHLLYTNLRLRELTGVDKLLPPHDIVILDEGHRAADIARDFVGFRVTRGMVNRVGRFLESFKERALERILSDAADQFFRDLDFYRKSRDYKTRLRRQNPVNAAGLIDALNRVRVTYNTYIDLNKCGNEEKSEVGKAADRAIEIMLQISEAMELKEPTTAYYIDGEDKSLALCSKPVKVDEWLKETLFDENDSVVVTSATISTGNSFEFMADEIGINAAASGHFEVEVPSPFDWVRNSLLVVPSTMPDPVKDRNNYNTAVVQHLKAVLDQAGGKTLALFTSWKMLNQAYEGCRYGRHRILKQGDMPRTKLIEEFKNDVSSSLFGTSSFWEGIDVPGESLSVVVIDKLPFPSPDDPVLDMLSADDDGTFFSYSIPRALITWKQGVGRLLRATSDRGVVVCLDPRLMSKWDSYGKKFYECLPRVQMSNDLRHISTFLNSK